MKLHYFLLLVCGMILFQNIHAQDTDVNLNLLKAPTSPGFILLNKQPSDIERPTSPTDFMVSLSNASTGFTAIPRNYAVEVAPCWLIGGNKITYEDAYGKNSEKNIGSNIWQSLTLSTAVATDDSSSSINSTHLGFGIKFSVIRGKVNDEFTNAMDSLKDVLNAVGQDFTAEAEVKLHQDPIWVKLDSLSRKGGADAEQDAALMELIENRTKQDLLDSVKGTYEAKLNKLQKVTLHRIGWFLDFAGGTVVDFPTQTFNNAEAKKIGAWITFGNESPDHLAMLAVARWLFEKDLVYTNSDSSLLTKNNSSIDAGLRIAYDRNRFSASIEGLFRSSLNITDLPSTWKGTFYLGYDLGSNKILSFNLTRDFDGTITKEGTLITALNLIMGFGSSRNIK